MDGNSNIPNEAIVSEAIAWHLRIEGGEMAARDWEAFTGWLERSAEHAATYDHIVDADADLISYRDAGETGVPVPANDDVQYTRRYVLGGFTAVAATAVAGIFLWPTAETVSFVHYETGLGETRTVAIADGVRVEMNGNTEIAVADNEPLVRLIEGEAAFFSETGQPGAVRVRVGEILLTDVGTIFNVIRHDGWIRLGVAEGEVIANPESAAVRVSAGHTLRLREGSGMIERGQTEAEDIVAWQQGQLAYSDTPAQIVASDLSRNFDVAVSIDQRIGERHLTGTIQLRSGVESVIREAASLLGGRAERVGDGWTIVGS